MENGKTKQKDTIKGKIILFIIGILVGAIISAAAFSAYIIASGVNNNPSTSSQQMLRNGTPPEMPSGQNNQNGTPPEMPNSNNSSQTDS